MKTLKCSVLVSALFLFFSSLYPLFAADDVFAISGAGMQENRFPEVAINPVTGDLLVVWERHDNPGFTIWASFCQRQQDGDYTVNASIKISAGTFAYRPSVCFSPAAARYLVAWERRAAAGSPGDIVGQLFSDSGGTIGGNMQLVPDTGDESYAIVRNLHIRGAAQPGQAAFIIACQSLPETSGTRFSEGGVVTHLISRNGERIGGMVQALAPSDNPGLGLGIARPADMAVGGDNSLVIACSRREPVAGGLVDVPRLVRCGADRVATGNVALASGSGTAASVTILSNKLSMVTWFREIDGSQDGAVRTYALPGLGAKSAAIDMLPKQYTDRSTSLVPLSKGGARLIGVRSAANPFSVVVKKKGKLKRVTFLGEESEQYAWARGVIFESGNELIVVAARFNGSFTTAIEGIVSPLK